MNRLYEEYIRDNSFEWREVHFFIVSDFVQDVGNKNAYNFSVERIAEKFSDVGKIGNAMFHLDVVGGAHHEVNSIVRVAESTVEWFQCRVHDVQGHRKVDHDFFNSFVPSKEKLIFYYVSNTSVVAPVKLLAGDQRYQGSEVILGLMRDVGADASPALSMQVSTAWNGVPCVAPRRLELRRKTTLEEALRPEILKPGMNRVVKIERQNDYICLQPLSVVDDGATYKLMIAEVGGSKDHKTYTLDVKFQRVFPPFASVTILCAAVLLVVSGTFVFFGVMANLWLAMRR